MRWFFQAPKKSFRLVLLAALSGGDRGGGQEGGAGDFSRPRKNLACPSCSLQVGCRGGGGRGRMIFPGPEKAACSSFRPSSGAGGGGGGGTGRP